MSVWKWSHYAIIEAVEPFKLHPTSMSYIYKVFEHLKQLWMGIWQHIHTVTTTDVSPDLGELAEIIDDVNLKTIPLHYCWGCRTFQTASHIHEIHHITHIQRGWAHWYAVHWRTAEALLHSVPTLLGSDFEVLGHLWWCEYVMVEADRFPHPYQTYTKCVSTLISLICCPLAYSSSHLTQLYPS
jgi:hypothetical protein